MAVTDEWLQTLTEDSLVAGEVGIPMDDLGLVQALTQVARRPTRVAAGGMRLTGELARVLIGKSEVKPAPRDWRFEDPTWQDNPLYRRVGQAYLSWCAEMNRLVDEADLDWRTFERARFAVAVLTSALAPTNTLPGNPAAIKRAFETAGVSLLRGARNFARDVRTNRGMPRQVDRGAFEVGRNLGVTPGAVVFRDERAELIQYTPTTERVASTPVLVMPPQINKYYLFDLAPGRSFVEYGTSRGLQMFVMSWRNPKPDHRDWSLSDYVGTTIDALDVMADITGSPRAHVCGFCAGGITAAVTEAHLAALGDDRVRSATFAVTLLDWHVPSLVGMLSAASVVAAGRKSSQRAGVLDGRALGHLFSMLRPNDLVWNYWVANNLMGQPSPRFDILAWNADSTRLPAGLHGDFLDLFERNTLTQPGELKLRNTAIDLNAVTADAMVVGAKGDHLTPWKGCYATTQLLGGPTEFVLSSSGHIQSLVNPPGNPKMSYTLGGPPEDDPDLWLEHDTETRQGSWWEHWASWVTDRSDGDRPAPKSLGSTGNPPIVDAPGTYVLEP